MKKQEDIWKKCKTCGIEFKTDNPNRVYCEFHKYGWNKTITDKEEVTKIIIEREKIERQKEKERKENMIRERILEKEKIDFMESSPEVIKELSDFDFEISSMKINIKHLTNKVEILEKRRNIYFEFEFKKWKQRLKQRRKR